MKRLARAWNCINTPEYIDKAQSNSIDNGEGMSVYRFLKPDEIKGDRAGNCEYYYADKGCMLWNTIFDEMPNKSEFEKTYCSLSMYAICVCVPADEHTNDTIQSVRIFYYDTNKEVSF